MQTTSTSLAEEVNLTHYQNQQCGHKDIPDLQTEFPYCVRNSVLSTQICLFAWILIVALVPQPVLEVPLLLTASTLPIKRALQQAYKGDCAKPECG